MTRRAALARDDSARGATPVIPSEVEGSTPVLASPSTALRAGSVEGSAPPSSSRDLPRDRSERLGSVHVQWPRPVHLDNHDAVSELIEQLAGTTIARQRSQRGEHRGTE